MVRTRIAPSPTGFPHLATIYQAMFDYVFAKRTGGQFIVRIEDTDKARFVEGAEEVIRQSLEWFRITSDESPWQGGKYGPYRQSERLAIYQKYVQELIAKKFAYYCFCTKERLSEMRKEQEEKRMAPMYDKRCLTLTDAEIKKSLTSGLEKVVRMVVPPNQKIVVQDVLSGEVEFDSNLIDHQILLKTDGFPTYHLAVVVDDYLMKITHIFRGQEWLPSTPKHVLLYQYFGWEDQMPQFVHLPLILNAEGGGKLSKRHGHASVEFYRREGYLPEAVLNYLANIVWNHPEGKEIFPFLDLGRAFEIESGGKIKKINISNSGARFDLRKLDWVNGEHIRGKSDSELSNDLPKYLKEFSVDPVLKNLKPEDLLTIMPIIKERIKKLAEFEPLAGFLFTDEITYGPDLVISKDLLKEALPVLEKLENWGSGKIEETLRKVALGLPVKPADLFTAIRNAISGSKVTPPLFESMEILGREKTLFRISKFIEKD